MVKIDMDYVSKHVTDVQQFLELCPNPNSNDIGKMLAIQAAVLQGEGLVLLQDAGLVPGAARIRRIALAVEVLRAAAESFLGADKILARNEMADRAFQRELEVRRIANEELLESLAGSGMLVSAGSAGEFDLVGRLDPAGGEVVVTQKRKRRPVGSYKSDWVKVPRGVQ